MIDAAVLDAMVAAGCTAEQVAAAVKASCASQAAAIEVRRAKDRARKAAKRAEERAACSDASSAVRGFQRTDADSTDSADTVSLSPVPLLPPTPPNNPLTPKPIQKNNSRGTRLPEDWTLGGPDLAYSISKGLSESETVALAERFSSWAWSAAGPNSVKRNWHQAWQGWVQREGPKILAARAGPPAGKGGFLSVLMDNHAERKNGAGNFEQDASGSGDRCSADERTSSPLLIDGPRFAAR